MGNEEIIDDAETVLVVDETQTDHPCEQQRPHELAYGKLDVELAELGMGLGTLQDGFKRLAIVLDDACLQCAVALLPIVRILATAIAGLAERSRPGSSDAAMPLCTALLGRIPVRLDGLAATLLTVAA